MPDPSYLTVLDVEALHVYIMEKTGGAPSPLRDRSLLESAVMRPQMAAYYADADLIEQAALLAAGISQAQAFVEGNKRTAFIAADVFLQINRCSFTGNPLEMAQQLEAIATRKGSEDEATARFTDWLRKHVTCDESS
jgi:death-on-curing protein